MNKGFERLKGVAVASCMGVGLLAGMGSARAATVTLSASVQRNGTTLGANWQRINNDSLNDTRGLSAATPSAVSTTISTITTTLGASGFMLASGRSAFAIGDAQLVTGISSSGITGINYSGPRDAFDGAMWMAVNQIMFVNPDNTVDLTGDTLTTDTVTDIATGIDAVIQYYFAPNRNVVRALYTLTNTTGADIAAEIRIGGNLGSDSRTFIQATSDGDLANEDTDLWHVSNDSNVNGQDGRKSPGVTISRCGTGAPLCPLNGVTLGHSDVNVDDFIYFYAVTVPANSSIRVLHFAEIGVLSNGLATRATDFESLAAAGAAGLLTGISAADQQTIVNYSATAGTATTADTSSSLFSVSYGLLTLFGLVPFIRSRRKTKI